MDKAKEWQNRPLESIYPIIFMDATVLKIRVERCIVHQIRSSLRYLSWKDRKLVARELKTIYTAPTEEDAQLALTEFNDNWGQKYPHIAQSWLNN